MRQTKPPRRANVQQGPSVYLPVPVNPTDCGLVSALSVKLSAPCTRPAAVGENFTVTEQFPPAGMLVPQEFLEMTNPALAVTLPNVSALLRRLVTVTLFAELVVLIVTVLKFSELVENVTGAFPVPDKLTASGLVGALSANISVPVIDPTLVGANVTPTVQLAPAAMPVPQVLLAMENPSLAAMLVKLRADVCSFVSVTEGLLLVWPTTAHFFPAHPFDPIFTNGLPRLNRMRKHADSRCVRLSDPCTEPADVGANSTPTEQFPLAGMLVPQKLFETTNPALAVTPPSDSGVLRRWSRSRSWRNSSQRSMKCALTDPPLRTITFLAPSALARSSE